MVAALSTQDGLTEPELDVRRVIVHREIPFGVAVRVHGELPSGDDHFPGHPNGLLGAGRADRRVARTRIMIVACDKERGLGWVIER